MAAQRKPLGITAERVAALLALDSSTEHGWRWRIRQPSASNDERMTAVWNAKYAGKARRANAAIAAPRAHGATRAAATP
jgi:hypothetical protein